MPRALSVAAREAIFGQEGGERVFLLVLTIEAAGIPAIRVVNNTLPVNFAGNHYDACAFMIALPAEQDDRVPEVKLRIDNVDRRIVEGVRLLAGPPTVTLAVILEEIGVGGSLEAGPFVFTLRGVEYTATEVIGTLVFEDILNDAYPKDSFTPSNFPGLFRSV